MQVELSIKRYNPETDTKPHWETYTVDMEPTDKVLDAIHEVKYHHDGTLALRRSCVHGVCGSDAMVINGVNRLACTLLIQDVGDKITVEPIRGLPVIKDLVVDMEPFFAQYRVGPALPRHHRRARLPGADSVRRRAGALRRHDQVHPLRRLHHVVPGVLGQLGLRGPGRHRQRPPLHLRLAGRGRGRAPRHPERAQRRVALPHRLQLHRCLPRDIKVTQAIEEVKREILYSRV